MPQTYIRSWAPLTGHQEWPRGYEIAQDIGRRMAGDAELREALRAWRHSRVKKQKELWVDTATKVDQIARKYLPPNTMAWAEVSRFSPRVIVLWSKTEPRIWDLHARALERGEVMLVLAPGFIDPSKMLTRAGG